MAGEVVEILSGPKVERGAREWGNLQARVLTAARGISPAETTPLAGPGSWLAGEVILKAHRLLLLFFNLFIDLR